MHEKKKYFYKYYTRCKAIKYWDTSIEIRKRENEEGKIFMKFITSPFLCIKKRINTSTYIMYINIQGISRYGIFSKKFNLFSSIITLKYIIFNLKFYDLLNSYLSFFFINF